MKTKEEIKAIYGTESYYAYKEGHEEGYIESINSLRNQAAIAAMQSFIGEFNINIRDSADYEKIAKLAVKQADALIEELKKK